MRLSAPICSLAAATILFLTFPGFPGATDSLRAAPEPVSPAAASNVVHRVNAGGPQLSGTPNWSADPAGSPSAFGNAAAAGSTTYSTSAPIASGHPSVPPGMDARLFQTERWDPSWGTEMQWSFPVAPGAYEVRLYFAELYFRSPNQRVFDVLVEGQLVLSRYDVVAEAGALTGVMKSFHITADSAVDIQFRRIVENPSVKAIEIIAVSTTPPPPQPVTAPAGSQSVVGSVVHRVNAGGPQLSATPNWSADPAGSPSAFGNAAAAGSTTYSTSASIASSHPSVPLGTDARLFQTERWDPSWGTEMQWSFPVAPGAYEVRLYFAELYFRSANQRVFDVLVEGQLVLSRYDVVAEVGALTGVMKSFRVTADSALDIRFRRIVENPNVQAIEIVALTTTASPPPPVPPPGGSQSVVGIQGDRFVLNGAVSYPGTAAEGLLLNSRMVQAIFDDENPSTRGRSAYPDTLIWDANRNVEEFIAALPLYAASGMRAVTVNLQGGSPGWSTNDHQPGIISAFRSDGIIKTPWLDRLDRVVRAASQQGIVVIVGLFYFGQDQRLADEAAVIRAVDGVTDWLIGQNYSNVLVEINNEADFGYNHAILQPNRVAELITRVKQRSGGRLKVSTSLLGGSLPSATLITASDYILLHGNSQSASSVAGMIDKVRASAAYAAAPKPIVFNEDSTLLVNLDAAVGRRASWGYYDQGQNNYRDGFQSPPVNWTINTAAKQAFFARVRALTGTAATVPSSAPVSSSGLRVASFTVINADTGQPIGGYDALPGGDISLDVSRLPTRNLSIRANTSPSLVGSVRFTVNNAATQVIENAAPYALFGDSGGKYIGWAFPIGTYVVSATPYSGANATGSAGQGLTLRLHVVGG